MPFLHQRYALKEMIKNLEILPSLTPEAASPDEVIHARIFLVPIGGGLYKVALDNHHGNEEPIALPSAPSLNIPNDNAAPAIEDPSGGREILDEVQDLNITSQLNRKNINSASGSQSEAESTVMNKTEGRLGKKTASDQSLKKSRMEKVLARAIMRQTIALNKMAEALTKNTDAVVISLNAIALGIKALSIIIKKIDRTSKEKKY